MLLKRIKNCMYSKQLDNASWYIYKFTQIKQITERITCLIILVHRVLFGKDPGIGWSRDSTKINCPRGSGKVSNYMLENVTVNFKYQEWDFTIHSSKRPLTSSLNLCFILNYENTVAFYQRSSQETNKMYTLNWSWVFKLTNIFSYQTGQSSTFVYHFYLFLKYAIRFVACKRW